MIEIEGASSDMGQLTANLVGETRYTGEWQLLTRGVEKAASVDTI